MNNEQPMSLLDDHHEEYGLNQLIFINSGSNAYSRLPLDKSLAITMSNNGGKSANLRALKLLLLPEVNFKDGQKKFSFQAADGTTYSNEDSFKFYFPSSSSFIIGEITNPHKGGAQYCQILMREPSERLGYRRWFIQATYEELEPLFFDTTSADNKGLGKPTYIEGKTAEKKFKELKGRLVTKKNELKKILFSTYSPLKPDSFFSLFPMSEEPTDEHIEAFKSLIHLAFNMKASDGASTAKAVSTILSRIVSDDEQFKVDIGKIPEEAHALFLEKVKLDAMVNLKADWDVTERIWSDSRQAIDLAIHKYATLKVSHAEHNDNYKEVIEAANAEYQKYLTAHSDLNNQKQTIVKKIDNRDGSIKTNKGQLKNLTDSINSANILRKTYAPLGCKTDIEIADYILNNEYQGILALEKMVTTLGKIPETENDLKNEIKKSLELKNRINTLNEFIDNADRNITNSLSVESASILTTLIPELITVSFDLTKKQIEIIDNFSSLFNINDDSKVIDFLGNKLYKLKYATYDHVCALESAKNKLEEEKSRLKQCTEQQITLNNTIKELKYGDYSSIEKCKISLAEAKEERKTISSAETNEDTYKKVEIELGRLENELLELKEKRKAIEENHSNATASLSKADNDRKNAYKIRDNLKNIENLLKQPNRDLYRIIGQSPDNSTEVSGVEVVETASMLSLLEELNKSINTINENNTLITKAIDIIIKSNCLDLSEHLPNGLIGTPLIKLEPVLKALSSEFGTLENHFENHSRRVVAHNHETSSQVTVIRDIIRQVSNFENEINSDLAGIRISDLSEIKIEIIKKKLFTVLAHDLENQINSYDQEVLQTDAFYERIQQFCDQVLTGTNGNINMEQIIESVRWHIKKNGQEEKASQSTGTQGLLNATLMMLLLKSMMQEHVTVKMPIIFDEIGSLDGSNFRTLREAAEERGFILLVASPETTGQIITELPAINLGLWELENIPKGLAKCCVVYNKAAERMTKLEIEGAAL